MSSIEKKKMIKLRSSDNKIVEVEEEVMLHSRAIKYSLMEDTNCDGVIIPLDNVKSDILNKVIVFCKKQTTDPDLFEKDNNNRYVLKDWHVEFLKVNHIVLHDLIQAANYLDIQSLLDMTCRTVANMIIGKSPEEIRKTFNIENDFTPEEEEELKKENEWAFR